MWNAISLVQDLNSCRRVHWPRSNGNERVLWIFQISSITGALLSDCLLSFQDNRTTITNTPRAPPITLQYNFVNLLLQVTILNTNNFLLFKQIWFTDGTLQILPFDFNVELRIMTTKGWLSTTLSFRTGASPPVAWGCRIHWLHLCKGVKLLPPTVVLDMTINNLIVRLL